jgi:hypothetical protein
MADDKTGPEPTEVNAPASPSKFATRSSRAPILELPRSVIANSTGLTFPAQLTEKDWLEVGRKLGRAGGSLQWWIGDWWAYGEHRYGDRKALVEADDWIGPSFGACMNCATVTRAFTETSRRREVLPYSHHVEVAALPPAEADLLLDEAEAQGLTIRALRERVKQVGMRSTIAAAARPRLTQRSLGPGEVPSQPVPVYLPRSDPLPRQIEEVEYVQDEEEAPAPVFAPYTRLETEDPATMRLRWTANQFRRTARDAIEMVRRESIGAAIALLTDEERGQILQDLEAAAAEVKVILSTNVVPFPKPN